LNSTAEWATAVDIIVLKELSRLDEVFRIDSNSCLWFFKSSSAASSQLLPFFNQSTASSARIT
jgi:hypothetical protein